MGKTLIHSTLRRIYLVQE